jgi:general secretion pathway protein L
MAEQLFLRLREDSDACSWVIVDADGRLLQGMRSGAPADLAHEAAGRRVVLLVPGLEVVTTKAVLPNASQARLRQMLPYSLEDTFAEDVDTLAFAIGPKLGSGAHQVSVVAKTKLKGWLGRLESAGISPQAAFADTDGVANTPSTLTVLIDGDTAYGRKPDQPALALQGLSLQQVFEVFSATDEGESPVQHAVVYLDAATQERYAAELALIASSLSSLDVKLMQHGPLPAFAAKLANDPGTNLLQGRYAPRSDWERLVKPWRVAAMLAAAAAGVSLLAGGAGYFKLRRQDAALTEVVTSRCREQMSTDRLTQCQTELQSLLGADGQADTGGESFLSILAAVAELATEADTFRSLSYRNRVLNIQLSASNVESLDEFERKLDGTGRFDMSIQSANPRDGGGIDARIQVVGLGP